MIWFRPLPQYGETSGKPWYDTRLARSWEIRPYLGRLWVKHFCPMPIMPPANDRDHCRW